MAAKPSIDEIALVARIAQQDQSALATLYDRYASVLYGLAFKILGTVEETEEVVLDVFQQVWSTAARYDPKKARVDTWLFMQIRSRALDKLRCKQRISRLKEVFIEAQPASNPVEDVIILERRTLVMAAIEQLPPEQQEVISLAYFKGLSHAEIALQTGVALGTIKTRIRLGLSKLRGILSDLNSS